jgi:dihydrolipoamide dehydrogenase
VDTINGFGSINGPGSVTVTHDDGSTTAVEAKAIIVATGSRYPEN